MRDPMSSPVSTPGSDTPTHSADPLTSSSALLNAPPAAENVARLNDGARAAFRAGVADPAHRDTYIDAALKMLVRAEEVAAATEQPRPSVVIDIREVG